MQDGADELRFGEEIGGSFRKRMLVKLAKAQEIFVKIRG